jgi:small subunit ribosomal protein S6
MATTVVPTDYEITYILRPSLEEAEVEEKVTAITELVKARGGEQVGDIERMGKRRLAYEIDDVREGYYFTLNFKNAADQTLELDRLMRLNESVLRHLIIKKDEKMVAATANRMANPNPTPPPAPIERPERYIPD